MDKLEQLEKDLEQIEKDMKEAQQEEAVMELLKEYHGEDEVVSFKDCQDILEKQKEIKTYKTGLTKLDLLVDGFHEGDVITITGVSGQGKCLGKGTELIMFNGNLKKVEDIQVDDLLMGNDSMPRKVLSLAKGIGNLYKINQLRGDSYIVNENHILSLKRTGTNKWRNDNPKKEIRIRKNRKNEIINISVSDYLKQSKHFKFLYKGYKNNIEWREKPILIDPYFLGIWLGDGHSNIPAITTMDKEIVDYLILYGEQLNLKIRVFYQKNNQSNIYSLTTGRRGGDYDRNSLLNWLKEYNLIRNKHIPLYYKANSRKIRLQLLAGLIDTDGWVNKPNSYQFCNKNEKLIEDVLFLARSLGFRCIKWEKIINEKKYFVIGINGDCSEIPVKVLKKKLSQRQQKKDISMNGIDIQFIGKGEYYGFEIDGNGLFLLKDFTVTHNTTLCQTLTKNFSDNNIKSLWFSYEVPVGQFLAKFGPDLPEGYLPKTLINRNLIWIERKIVEGLVKFQTRVVFIDHLHYLFDFGSVKNPSLVIGDIMRQLKIIAKKYNVIIVLVAHLTKVKPDSRITMDLIRDCLPGDQLVYVNGQRKRVDKVKVNDKVLSRSGISTLQDDVIIDVWKSGKKKIYKITIKSGRVIEASDGHKFYATTYKRTNKFGPKQGTGIAGWVELKNLQVGQKISVVKKYPELNIQETISEKRALFLGWLVGDGHITKSYHSEITVATLKEIEILKQVLQTEFGLEGKFSKYKDKNAYRFYITNGTRGKDNKAKEWLEKEDICFIGQNKRVPAIVFQQPNNVVSKFLSGLFQADGSVCKNGNFDNSYVITLNTISEILARDVQNLLLRFGIVAFLRKQSLKSSGFRTKTGFIWSLSIRGYDIVRFKKFIGFYAEKQDKLLRLTKNCNSNVRKKDSNLYFEKIKSIEYMGIKDTYDISVRGYHSSLKNNSFCVNDFITHNSSFTVQESDYVLAIWRMRSKSKDKESRDDVEEGDIYEDKAKLSVEKNRYTGKTGIIELHYIFPYFYDEPEKAPDLIEEKEPSYVAYND